MCAHIVKHQQSAESKEPWASSLEPKRANGAQPVWKPADNPEELTVQSPEVISQRIPSSYGGRLSSLLCLGLQLNA